MAGAAVIVAVETVSCHYHDGRVATLTNVTLQVAVGSLRRGLGVLCSRVLGTFSRGRLPGWAEGFTLSYANGGTAWLLAISLWRQSLTAELRPSLFLRRDVSCVAYGTGLSGLCWVLGVAGAHG